ncbi:MAG: hypothetical protein Udaeo2_26950 [Candidatus Udaeobacter sp.]|nr:MAG: hypothetical protein Udaeo2_26950 [Candidatus Udaeobacter sp.]
MGPEAAHRVGEPPRFEALLDEGLDIGDLIGRLFHQVIGDRLRKLNPSLPKKAAEGTRESTKRI